MSGIVGAENIAAHATRRTIEWTACDVAKKSQEWDTVTAPTMRRVIAPIALCCLLAPSLAPAQTAQAPRARESRWITLFSLRGMIGGAGVFSHQAEARGEFAFDLTVGLRFHRQRADGWTFILAPEVGFTPLQREEDITALWLMGASFGVGSPVFNLAWAPRFVVGAVGHESAVGMRNGVVLTAIAGLVCAEVSHQYLALDGGSENDVRVTIGADVGLFVHHLMRSIR